MECRFYGTEEEVLRSHEIGPQHGAPSIARLIWCEHPKHSPLPEQLARSGVLDATTRLPCGGETKACPLMVDGRFWDM